MLLVGGNNPKSGCAENGKSQEKKNPVAAASVTNRTVLCHSPSSPLLFKNLVLSKL